MKPVDIAVTSDFICPWCWIGHQNLKAALKETKSEVAPVIRYLPYELNPNMPKEGMNRRLYRSTKFGSWAKSQAMDADVTLAGKRAGVNFDYDTVEMTPNTRLAHRLMYFGQQHKDAEKAEQLFDAIFSTYFAEGKDIGKLEVLVEIGAKVGLDKDAVQAYLAGDGGDSEVVAAEAEAHASHVRSVPTIRMGRSELTGAQPSAMFAGALAEAAGIVVEGD